MLIFGQNEAETRLMKELNETNPEGTQYPKATNNRGSEGGHYLNPSETGDKSFMGGKKREAHAGGDMVGNRAQPGESLGKAMKKGGRKCHSEGEEVVSLKHEQPGGGRGMKKGGLRRMRHAEGDDVGARPMKHGGRR